MDEVWKPVVGYETYYEVNSAGRVRNVAHGGRLVHGFVEPNGHRRVHLVAPGRPGRGCAVHVLVAEAFLGPRPPGHVVNFKNDNTFDTSVGNLEFVTRPCWNKLAARRGRCTPGWKHGEQNIHAKLTAVQVRELRALRQEGWSIRALADQFGVAVATAHRAATGRCWKSVEAPSPAHAGG